MKETVKKNTGHVSKPNEEHSHIRVHNEVEGSLWARDSLSVV